MKKITLNGLRNKNNKTLTMETFSCSDDSDALGISPKNDYYGKLDTIFSLYLFHWNPIECRADDIGIWYVSIEHFGFIGFSNSTRCCYSSITKRSRTIRLTKNFWLSVFIQLLNIVYRLVLIYFNSLSIICWSQIIDRERSDALNSTSSFIIGIKVEVIRFQCLTRRKCVVRGKRKPFFDISKFPI